jgi:hypothetical protein
MTFHPRSLFSRRAPARDFTTVDDLIAAVRKQLAIEEAGPGDADAIRGQLAGALTPGPSTFARDPALGSPPFRAGFLAGHLHAQLIRTTGTLQWESILPTTVYAASLLIPRAGRLLDGAGPNIVAAHTYACLRAVERGDVPLAVELAMFHWLADHYSIAVTPELLERFDHARSRRLELRVALDTERSLGAPKAAEARSDRRIRELTIRVERQIAAMEPGSPEIDRGRGVLAGLRTGSGSGPFPAGADDAASESYWGGQLGGDLLASLIRDDRVPSEALRSICYRYGATLATTTGGVLLGEAPPTNLLKAHALGMSVLRRGAGPAAIIEDLEVALLTWLAGRLEVPLTPELLERRKRYVARRRTAS